MRHADCDFGCITQRIGGSATTRSISIASLGGSRPVKCVRLVSLVCPPTCAQSIFLVFRGGRTWCQVLNGAHVLRGVGVERYGRKSPQCGSAAQALQRRQEIFLRSPDAFAAVCRQQGLGVPEVRKMSDAFVYEFSELSWACSALACERNGEERRVGLCGCSQLQRLLSALSSRAV